MSKIRAAYCAPLESRRLLWLESRQLGDGINIGEPAAVVADWSSKVVKDRRTRHEAPSPALSFTGRLALVASMIAGSAIPVAVESSSVPLAKDCAEGMDVEATGSPLTQSTTGGEKDVQSSAMTSVKALL